MSKKKQIEEMAHIVSYAIETWVHEAPSLSNPRFVATAIYCAGYRKQRTAKWVTNTETEDGVIVRYTHRCTDCNYFYKTVCPRGDDYCHKCGARMKGGEKDA